MICLGLTYAPGRRPAGDTWPRRDAGNISVYARNRDYHDVVKGMLKHLGQFIVAGFAAEVKVFVDTAPVMEKPLAAQAGLGWQGKHTNLVSRRHGSWLFLGEIYTTLELPPDPPHARSLRHLHALPARLPDRRLPRAVPARCHALHLLPHHRACRPDPDATAPGDGQPHLRLRRLPRRLSLEPLRPGHAARETAARADLLAPDLAELAGLDDAAFRRRFAGSPVKRIGRDRFVRNVLIAIGNSGDRTLLPHVDRLAADPNPVVAEAACWAAQRLRVGNQ